MKHHTLRSSSPSVLAATALALTLAACSLGDVGSITYEGPDQGNNADNNADNNANNNANSENNASNNAANNPNSDPNNTPNNASNNAGTCTDAQQRRYYLDRDQDGFGLDDDSLMDCEPRGSYRATVGGDCDDNAMQIHPEVEERCDGKDNNCNEQTDEGVTNACGGCMPLSDTPGSSCGEGDCQGEWVCRSNGNAVRCEGEGVSVCGQCSEGGDNGDEELLGQPCGSCGTWVCDGEGEVICMEGEPNACGGCSELSNTIGAACGECGEIRCEGEEDTRCDDPGLNVCGGCGPDPEELGDPCPDGCGTLVCGRGGDLMCDNSGVNMCGGCEALDEVIGTHCGTCGQWVCRLDDNSTVCAEFSSPGSCLLFYGPMDEDFQDATQNYAQGDTINTVLDGGIAGGALHFSPGGSVVYSAGEDHNGGKAMVDLWLRPDYDSNDSVTHPIFAARDLLVLKRGMEQNIQNTIQIILLADTDNPVSFTAASNLFGWRSGDWVRVTVIADVNGLNSSVRLFLNEQPIALTAPTEDVLQALLGFTRLRLNPIRLGALEVDDRTFDLSGALDDVKVYPFAPQRPMGR